MIGWAVVTVPLRRLGQLVNQSELDALPKAPLSAGDGGTFENAITLAFGLAGGIALVILAYASLRYVLSRGSPEETTKARSTIIDALIGLALIIASFGIVSFVMEYI